MISCISEITTNDLGWTYYRNNSFDKYVCWQLDEYLKKCLFFIQLILVKHLRYTYGFSFYLLFVIIYFSVTIGQKRLRFELAYLLLIQQVLQKIYMQTFAFNQDSFSYSSDLNLPYFGVFDLPENDRREGKTVNIIEQPEVVIKKNEETSQKSVMEVKVSKPKVNNYPTKNCLALFKSAHYAYLLRGGINHKKFSSLVALKNKNGAAREDFLMLYKIKELREVWKQMFSYKFIYRYVMTSRALSTQKKNYQSRIKVLQKAFHRLQFERLNDK